MWMFLLRAALAGVTIAIVVELANHLPRVGALILTLPLTTLIGFVFTWYAHRELGTIVNLSRETLVLVPLGLPFFVPLAFADKWGLGFWAAFAIGVAAASACLGSWLLFGPKLS